MENDHCKADASVPRIAKADAISGRVSTARNTENYSVCRKRGMSERRVPDGRADEDDRAFFDKQQKCVLPDLVEPVHLIDRQHGLPPGTKLTSASLNGLSASDSGNMLALGVMEECGICRCTNMGTQAPVRASRRIALCR